MASVKMSSVNSKGLLVLLGLTVAYQIFYQAILLGRLPEDSSDFPGSDAVCQVGSLTSGTPACLEQQLFRSWQRAEQGGVLGDDEEELERLTQVRLDEFRSPVAVVQPKVDVDNQGAGIIVGQSTPLVSFGTAGEIEKIYNQTLATLNNHSVITPWAQQLQESQAQLEARQEHLPSVQHNRHQKFEEDFEKMYEQTMEAIHKPHKSSYAQHAEEMMAEMEKQKREIESRPSVKHARALERQARLDRLYNETLASIRNRHVAQDYAEELSDMMHKFEDRADHLPSIKRAKALESQRKFDDLYEATMANLQNHSSTSAWGEHLKEEQQEMQYKLEHLHDHDHAKKGAAVPPQNSSLLDQIVQLGNDLCDTPERRARPSCAEFVSSSFSSVSSDSSKLSPEALARHQRHADWRARLTADFANHSAQLDKSLHDLEEKDHVWEEAFQSSASSYLEELCSDPERAGYPACATLRKTAASTTAEPTVDSTTSSAGRLRGSASAAEAAASGAVSTSAPSSRLRGAASMPAAAAAAAAASSISTTLASRLRGASAPSANSWAAVVAATAGKGKRSGKEAVAVTREQLMTFQWEGKLPSVACIAPITAEAATERQISALVSNFRLQTYEGRRSLALLYKASDSATAELLQRFADGVLVKAVAARNTGEFPSTTALRYGSWAADADIIARWNADEWYHPQRLSMQIESMVLAARPVSLLKSWTLHGSSASSFETSVADKVGWEGSMVGEASWMKQHWMPMLEEERLMLGGVQAGSVVQLDMPELLAYRVDESSADYWHSVLLHFHIDEAQVSLLEAPKACTALPATVAAVGTMLQHDVTEKLGAELGDIYKTLVRSREAVSGSLRTLCEELAEEKQPAQYQRLATQAEHISDILKQINERFDAVQGLLH